MTGTALISIPEAARLLGVSTASGYRMARAGQLPLFRIGGDGSMKVVRARLVEEFGIADDAA